MPGRPDLEEWGAESHRPALMRSSRFFGSGRIRVVLSDVLESPARTRPRPGVDVDEFMPEHRAARVRRAHHRGGSICRTATSAIPDPGNAVPHRARRSRATCRFRVRRQAHREQGRPGALRGVAGARRTPQSSSASATTALELEADCASRHALHRSARASPPRRHLLPLRDVAVVPSTYPRRLAWSGPAGPRRAAARRRGALRPRRDGGRHAPSFYPPELSCLTPSPTVTRTRSRERLRALFALRRRKSAKRSAPPPGVQSSAGAGRRVAHRLLEPLSD